MCSVHAGDERVQQDRSVRLLHRGRSAGGIALSLRPATAGAISDTCLDCHILLVEPNSATDTDLFTAVDTAVRLGAVAVSNSYGEGESAAELGNDAHLNHPGVAITASSGDSGYGVSFPA